MYRDDQSDLPKLFLRPVLVVPRLEGNKAQLWLKINPFQDNLYKVNSDSDYIYFPIKIRESEPEIVFPWTIKEKLVFKRKAQISCVDEIKKILPAKFHDLIPHSYDQIGAVLLLKLNSELFLYKKQIGSIYLKCLPINAVFIKTSDVNSDHRIRNWESIAGKPTTEIDFIMHQLRFKVEINKVYFNTRLSSEYAYIATQISASDIIIDMFAGIGPFSLMCAKYQPVTVYSIDINSKAISLLLENIKRNNKILKGNIETFVGDSRHLILRCPMANRIIMNFPSKARTFLESALKRINHLGVIHLHEFVQIPKNDSSFLKTSQSELRKEIDLLLTKLHLNKSFSLNYRILRDISPSKTHIIWDIQINN